MTITLDEKYNAKTDIATLGYVGETNARIITFENYQCEDADNYKMRFKYSDGVTYDVDISGGTYTIDGSILRCVGAVYVQILACKQNGDSYEYVKKSNILTLQIGRSLGGKIAPVPTYEQSIGILEKLFEIDKKIDNTAKALNEAITAANTAKNDLQTATSAANTAIAAVKTSTAGANTAKSDLDTATANADIAQSNLSAAKSAAETALSNLNTAIAQAETSDGNLTATISNAETAKTQLSDVIANADSINAELAETISTATDLYTLLSAENATAAENISKLAEEKANAGELYMKSDGIVCSAEGSGITLNDSSELPFSGMRVFGRSEQLTTTGAQLLNIKQSGLPGQIGDITLTVNADGSITVTGDYTTSGDGNVFTRFLGEYIDLLEDGKTYATSDCRVKVVENGVNRYWSKFTVNKSTMTSIQPYLQLSGNEYYSGMTIYPMLNAGETAMPFEPYTGGVSSPNPDYPQEIVSVGDSGNVEINVQGENLLQNRIITVRGVNTSVTDGILKMVGTVDNTNSTSRIYWASTNLKNILTPGKTYYLWCDDPNIHFRFLESNITHNDVSNYTVTGNETEISVWVILGDSAQAEGEKIDVTARVSLTECEPQDINISTPNGLPGIPVTSGGNYTDENGQQWICDEIDFKRGVYVRRIHEQVFNGTENWKINDTANKYFMFSATPDVSDTSKQLIGLCDKTKIISYQDLGKEKGYGIAFIYFWRCNFAECDANNGATVDDLKSFLSNNPMTVKYVGTVTETPLTSEQIAAYKSLHTNKPTTVITNSDSAHMAVSYTADTKTYIDNKFAELATAIVATGGDT